MTFRFPALTLATALAFALLVGLGVWQLQRLEWKRALMAQTEARLAAAPLPFDEAVARSAREDMEYQPVFITGAFAHDLRADVFGALDGAAGVFVFTPLDAPTPGGGRRFVYVNRGFAPQSARDSDGEAGGEIRVEGLLRRAERRTGLGRLFRPVDQPSDNLYFARDPSVLAERHGIAASKFYIDSFGRENAGAWPKGGVTRVAFPNRHLEYALTWFGLAAALLCVYVAYSMRR